MSQENLESKRWLIAGAAIIMQLCLGTVYAWSVFKKPLMTVHGWGDFEVQVTMMILMVVIGVSAAFGGTLVDKKGPRFVATIGGILFGSGTLIAGYADQVGNLYLLYLGFGIIAGLGNGFGYVTPIATLIRWFPDKRGLISGLAVMGFGAGAFFMGKIAPGMINDMGMATTFYIWGAIFLVVVTGAAQFFKNPQGMGSRRVDAFLNVHLDRRILQFRGSRQEAPVVDALGNAVPERVRRSRADLPALPMAQEVIRKSYPEIGAAELAVQGGTILAIASIFNGLGGSSGRRSPTRSAAEWSSWSCSFRRPPCISCCRRSEM